MTIDVSEEQNTGFGCMEITVVPGDLIYMSTDGFADQLGGPRHKKYRTDLFKNLLVNIHNLPLSEQKEILEKEFISWKGTNPQTDDILVAGLRI